MNLCVDVGGDASFGKVSCVAVDAAQSDVMSVAEFKRQAEKLKPAETLHLAAYLKHLARRRDSSYLASLDATWRATEAGDRISLAEFKKITAQLRKSGV